MDVGAEAARPLLRMEKITKSFSGVRALDGVDLTLARGEVHALVGENGAGKSTLIKILTGAYALDGGRIELEGRSVHFRRPQDAQHAGVVAVYQEVNLLAFRTVSENIFLGREPRRFGLIDWGRMNKDAAALLARLGLEIDPRATLGSLNIALRQMVAIARGVSLGAKVIVLDEPTSSLTEKEVAILYGVIRRLRDEGAAVVYISHRFDELYAVCDRVTILRDGKLVGTRHLAELDRLDLICLMLGKDREELRRRGTTAFATEPRRAGENKAPLLRAENLTRGRRLNGVSLSAGRGEIVGLAGLLGSGRTETARAIFGADEIEKGEVYLNDRLLKLRGVGDAIDAGLAFLSEDRKGEGIIPELSVRENLTLAALPTLSRFGVVSRRRQREIVDRFIERLKIKTAGPEQKIRELSGGNQQKVLLARWLCRRPIFLLLDEPTRGIDIGAKGEIQSLVAELAAEGLGVLLISSELEELVEGCARVLVMREGRCVAEQRGDEISTDAIIHAMANEKKTNEDGE
ncbi:MAG TPA: sugar ABC transporter ATP-binding protein [Pyrinomonadaceae bacterium]|jgi:ribose transport system ATP-binding protein|nr:sugar ABC transporter ATP-binding protein [Pyrinomonadaceae bacterium]